MKQWFLAFVVLLSCTVCLVSIGEMDSFLLILGSYFLRIALLSLTISYRIAQTADSHASGFVDYENYVKHVMECRNIPAVVISMVKNNKIVFSKGFGHKDINSNISATENTKVPIGSVTKAFTSTLLVQLLSQQDRYTLDTPLREILGPFFELSDELRTKHVNLRDVLAHKVGVPSYFHPLLVGFHENVTRTDFVRQLRYMPATKWFRAKFIYSNYMYALAGHVAEVLGGDTWEHLVQSRLLDALGMTDTGFVDGASNLDEIATPYVLWDGKFVSIDKKLVLAVSPAGPAGSLFSTAADMAKWMMFHLNRGRIPKGKTLVPQQWLEETYTAQMAQSFNDRDITRPEFPIEDASTAYNLGWASSSYRGFRKIWHSGGISTYVSQLWLYPDMNAGIFMASSGPSNSESSRGYKAIVSHAADLLLGEQPWLNKTTACTYPQPWKAKDDNCQEPLSNHTYQWNISKPQEEYVGIYGHMGFGNITIYIENRIRLTLLFGRFGKMYIQPVSNSSFTGLYTGPLWFTRVFSDYNPVRIEFVWSDMRAVDGVLFPIDFDSDRILFEKNLNTEGKYTLYSTSTVSCKSSSADSISPYVIRIIVALIVSSVHVSSSC